MTCPIEVPATGPLYAGHFPGRPILPGVGLLDLALRALGAGTRPALREIPSLRLRRLVLPGDALELDVQPLATNGRVRLEVRRAADLVANGVVVLGEPFSGAELPLEHVPQARVPRSGAAVPDLEELLPHRPPMRFVEEIMEERSDGIVCAVRVPARGAFDTAGFAPAFLALEMAAQSAGVFEALRRFRDSGEAGARLGYLVGARDVRFMRSQVPAAETLFSAIRISGIAPPLTTYMFEVAWGREVVATGIASAWLTATDA